MSVKNSNFLENELEDYLPQLENRLEQVGQPGLVFHTRVIKWIFDDLKKVQNDNAKKIRGELMQIESIAYKNGNSSELLEKIRKLKGIVGLICFGVISLTLLPNVHAVRRPSSGRMKMGRIEMEAEG